MFKRSIVWRFWHEISELFLRSDNFNGHVVNARFSRIPSPSIMSEIEGQSQSDVESRKPAMATRWQEMSRREQKLYLQAEKEFETGTVSAKVLEDAKQRSSSDEETERYYIQLRYRQLWRQSVSQQKKVAAHLSRQKQTDSVMGATLQEPRHRRSSTAKTLMWTVLILASLAALGWVVYANLVTGS